MCDNGNMFAAAKGVAEDGSGPLYFRAGVKGMRYTSDDDRMGTAWE